MNFKNEEGIHLLWLVQAIHQICIQHQQRFVRNKYTPMLLRLTQCSIHCTLVQNAKLDRLATNKKRRKCFRLRVQSYFAFFAENTIFRNYMSALQKLPSQDNELWRREEFSNFILLDHRHANFLTFFQFLLQPSKVVHVLRTICTHYLRWWCTFLKCLKGKSCLHPNLEPQNVH